MDNLKDDFLKPVSQNFSDHLETVVRERDGSIIIDGLRGIFLRYQCDKSIVEALQVQVA